MHNCVNVSHDLDWKRNLIFWAFFEPVIGNLSWVFYTFIWFINGNWLVNTQTARKASDGKLTIDIFFIISSSCLTRDELFDKYVDIWYTDPNKIHFNLYTYLSLFLVNIASIIPTWRKKVDTACHPNAEICLSFSPVITILHLVANRKVNHKNGDQ